MSIKKQLNNPHAMTADEQKTLDYFKMVIDTLFTECKIDTDIMTRMTADKKMPLKEKVLISIWSEHLQAKKEYAELKCAEQRQICADSLIMGDLLEPKVLFNKVLTAKQPEL